MLTTIIISIYTFLTGVGGFLFRRSVRKQKNTLDVQRTAIDHVSNMSRVRRRF